MVVGVYVCVCVFALTHVFLCGTRVSCIIKNKIKRDNCRGSRMALNLKIFDLSFVLFFFNKIRQSE